MKIDYEFDASAVFVFLAITWDEADGEYCDAFGPFLVCQDGSHLGAIEDTMKDWRSRYSERLNMAAHLFATGYERRLDSTPKRAGA